MIDSYFPEQLKRFPLNILDYCLETIKKRIIKNDYAMAHNICNKYNTYLKRAREGESKRVSGTHNKWKNIEWIGLALYLYIFLYILYMYDNTTESTS